MIVGIVGRTVDGHNHMCSLGTGKDTVADALAESHNFTKVALADPMKRFCMEVYNFSWDQLWGPSSSRNAVDERYPREKHDYQGGKCACCGAFYYEERGWNVDQCYLTPRYALQQLGTEWGRNCFNDTWVRYGMKVADKLLRAFHYPKTHDWYSYVPAVGIIEGNMAYCYDVPRPDEVQGVVFSDVRFENEVEYIKKEGGKVLLVYRKVDELPAGVNIDHQSEYDLNKYGPDDGIWDGVLYNDASVEDLGEKTGQALEALRGTV